MVKIAFKSPFQQYPLLFSLQVNGNHVLSGAQAKNLGVIFDSFLSFTPFNPADPRASTFTVYPESSHFSPPQCYHLSSQVTIIRVLENYISTYLTGLPHSTNSLFSKEQPGWSLKNISQTEPFRSLLSHSIKGWFLITAHKPHIPSTPHNHFWDLSPPCSCLSRHPSVAEHTSGHGPYRMVFVSGSFFWIMALESFFPSSLPFGLRSHVTL